MILDIHPRCNSTLVNNNKIMKILMFHGRLNSRYYNSFWCTQQSGYDRKAKYDFLLIWECSRSFPFLQILMVIHISSISASINDITQIAVGISNWISQHLTKLPLCVFQITSFLQYNPSEDFKYSALTNCTWHNTYFLC